MFEMALGVRDILARQFSKANLESESDRVIDCSTGQDYKNFNKLDLT
jgi:hypothetical protein